MDEPFYKDGLSFSCQRCSGCCRIDPGFVFLSEEDIGRLLVWASAADGVAAGGDVSSGVPVGREAFIERWCRWVPRGDGFEYLCLKEKKNYDCILWNGGCTAYEYRPLQCSSYPFWPSLLTDEDWWEANARDCPGVNKGKRHSREEIEAHLTKRKNEPYIHRKAK